MALDLLQLCGRIADLDDPDYTFLADMDERPYREWVRTRLREEQFFTRLDNGLASLPDIRLAVPALLRPIETMMYPKSQAALMRHLARNLEWYLCKDGSTRALKWRASLYIGIAPILLSLLTALTINLAQHGQTVNWIILLNMLPLIVPLCQGVLLAGEPPGSGRFVINAAELYHYIVELHTTEDDANEW